MSSVWEIGIAGVTLVLNISILLLNARIRADISNVKVYMHEKFLTREEFLYAMNPPSFNFRPHSAQDLQKPL